MPKFVIDEDMPRSTGRILKQRGYDVRDIRDYGLRGAEDEEIYEFAQREKAVILNEIKRLIDCEEQYGLCYEANSSTIIRGPLFLQSVGLYKTSRKKDKIT
jgi:uncharacterized protein with PIN domain